jgi:hypothetical protein
MKTVIVQSQQRWENMVVTRRTEVTLLEELNEFGQKGWEVVSVLHYKDPKGIATWSGFLKRPCAVPPATLTGNDEAIDGGTVNVLGTGGSVIESAAQQQSGIGNGVAMPSSIPRAVKIDSEPEYSADDGGFRLQEDA